MTNCDQPNNEPITHLVIARAADADADGAHVQMKLSCRSEPNDETLRKLRDYVQEAFGDSIGREPSRVAVAVLPYVADLDDDGERADDEFEESCLAWDEEEDE